MSKNTGFIHEVVAADIKSTYRLMDFIISQTQGTLAEGGLEFTKQMDLQSIIRVSGEYRVIVEELADQLNLKIEKEKQKELGKLQA